MNLGQISGKLSGCQEQPLLKGKFPQTTIWIWWVESNFRNPSVIVWAEFHKRSDYAKWCMSPSLDGTLPAYVISQEDNSATQFGKRKQVTKLKLACKRARCDCHVHWRPVEYYGVLSTISLSSMSVYAQNLSWKKSPLALHMKTSITQI